MAKSNLRFIPGSHEAINFNVASYASNAASATQPAFTAPADGTITAINLMFVASQVSTTKTDGITVVNLGTAGTGTTVIGTFSATKAIASYAPVAVDLAAAPTFTDGQSIGFCWASAAATTIQLASTATIELQYT